MNPFFSIIIPVYNVAPYLRECLDSVLAQTFGDWEAICIDDGSTDGSGAILDEYAAKDARFRVFHQANAGVSAARNKGLDVAKGEWLLFVDADDWIDPMYLQDFVCREDKADVTFFPGIMNYPDGMHKVLSGPATPIIRERRQIDRILHLLKNNGVGDIFGWTWNKIWRRSVIDRHVVRFPHDVNFFEDELFAISCCMHIDSVQVCNRPYYHYRITDGGLTAEGRKTSAAHGQIAAAFWRFTDMLGSGELLSVCLERFLYFQLKYFSVCPRMKVSNSVVLCARQFPTEFLNRSGRRFQIMRWISNMPWLFRHLGMWMFLVLCKITRRL